MMIFHYIIAVVLAVVMIGCYYVNRKRQVLRNDVVEAVLITVLSLFLSLMGGFFLRPEDRALSDLKETKLELKEIQNELAGLKAALIQYKQRCGQFPSNDLGIFALTNEPNDVSHALEYYLYENRRGLMPSQFTHSLVNNDKSHQYSTAVDADVYLCSVDGYYCAERYRELWWTTCVPCGIGLATVTIAVVGVLLPKGRWIVRVLRLIAAILGAAAGYYLGAQYQMMCYMGIGSGERSPTVVVKQLELIEQYHTNGVINDETYRRLKEATSNGRKGR